jgi:hypothetical protein
MRSDDAGATFTDLTNGTPNYLHSQGNFDTSLIVDPANSAIVYAGGDSTPKGIITSTDGGAHWTDIGGQSTASTGRMWITTQPLSTLTASFWMVTTEVSSATIR